jgi:hypothetical protein
VPDQGGQRSAQAGEDQDETEEQEEDREASQSPREQLAGAGDRGE